MWLWCVKAQLRFSHKLVTFRPHCPILHRAQHQEGYSKRQSITELSQYGFFNYLIYYDVLSRLSGRLSDLLRVGLVEVGSGWGSAPGLGILSWMPLMARTLLTLVLNPTGTNHFYCQSILGLCSCGNKSFFQSSLFNLASVCVCGGVGVGVLT